MKYEVGVLTKFVNPY